MTLARSPRRAPRASSRGHSPRDPKLAAGIAALAATLLLAPGLALAGNPKPKPKPTAPPATSCATCVEKRPTLDPARFATGFEPAVREGYAIARRYPAMLDKLHCFCECAESPMFRHKTLLTCYTDMHAAGCGICLSEARLAAQLKEKGLSDTEIKNTVESVHRTDGHPAT